MYKLDSSVSTIFMLYFDVLMYKSDNKCTTLSQILQSLQTLTTVFDAIRIHLSSRCKGNY